MGASQLPCQRYPLERFRSWNVRIHSLSKRRRAGSWLLDARRGALGARQGALGPNPGRPDPRFRGGRL